MMLRACDLKSMIQRRDARCQADTSEGAFVLFGLMLIECCGGLERVEC